MSVDFIESFEQGVKILFTSILQILYAGYRIIRKLRVSTGDKM